MIFCRICEQQIQGCSNKPYRKDYKNRDKNGNITYVCPKCHGGR